LRKLVLLDPAIGVRGKSIEDQERVRGLPIGQLQIAVRP
jgi:hypothetical protein